MVPPWLLVSSGIVLFEGASRSSSFCSVLYQGNTASVILVFSSTMTKCHKIVSVAVTELNENCFDFILLNYKTFVRFHYVFCANFEVQGGQLMADGEFTYSVILYYTSRCFKYTIKLVCARCISCDKISNTTQPQTIATVTVAPLS